MIAGNAGTAIMFACFAVGAGIIGLYVFVYLAHCVLVVLVATAAGADRVAWPDEPYLAWMGEALTLAFLSLISVIPLGLVAGALLTNWLTDQPGLRILLCACLGLWLFFPVAVLSCLTAESRWICFRPVIVLRMVQILPWTLVFYAASGVVLIVAVVPIRWSLSGSAMTLFLTVPLTAAMVLIYPRLLGLLALKIGQLGPLESSGWKSPGQRRAEPPAVTKGQVTISHSLHIFHLLRRAHVRAMFRAMIRTLPIPWPTKVTPSFATTSPALRGSPDPAAGETATASREPRYRDDETRDAEQGYDLAAAHAPNPTIAQDYVKPRRAPSESGQLSRKSRHPAAAYLVGVFAFPWYRTNLPTWLRLSLAGLVWSFLIVQTMYWMPF